MSDLPEGYELVQRTQGPGFAGLAGPFYAKREGRALSLGLRIEQRHLNSRGSCHGGLLATLPDIALRYACVAPSEDGQSRNFVTIDLAVEDPAPTQARAWLSSAAKGGKAGTRTAPAPRPLPRG